MEEERLVEGMPTMSGLEKLSQGGGLLCSVIVTKDGRYLHIVHSIHDMDGIGRHCHVFQKLVEAQAGGMHE